ncbi:intradiol ring-cleavage dioxygenase [Algicella marina]|uniref:Intradiol ring-cleavage dioxygenase n=1 Tax=Algicella marina TaxID=2683284 RepID=A0A6P1STZ3_9RHOB|nr:intradiol ring-cleavage dioxygenase [Algicella marina]QHQ34164.1 intradiol ring-cleavage dioxygenase [Algicella marina]
MSDSAPTNQGTHAHGLKYDLPHLFGRRRAISSLAALTLVSAAGRGMAADGSCVAIPAETAGPFPADGSNRAAGQTVNVLQESGVMRDDLRTSFAGMSPVAEGVEVQLILHLVEAGTACTPLAGRAIYVWHCDAAGRYSLYEDRDRNYLRGLGVSDANGIVRLTTVFPGCYRGRWPHIHFEVFDRPADAVAGSAGRLTSQLALPAAACNDVYARDPRYHNSVANLRGQSLARDGIFRDNTPDEIEQQTLSLSGSPATGFEARAVIGLG